LFPQRQEVFQPYNGQKPTPTLARTQFFFKTKARERIGPQNTGYQEMVLEELMRRLY